MIACMLTSTQRGRNNKEVGDIDFPSIFNPNKLSNVHTVDLSPLRAKKRTEFRSVGLPALTGLIEKLQQIYSLRLLITHHFPLPKPTSPQWVLVPQKVSNQPLPSRGEVCKLQP